MSKSTRTSTYNVPGLPTVSKEIEPPTCGTCRYLVADRCHGVPPTPVNVGGEVLYVRAKVGARDVACGVWGKMS